MRVSVYGAGRIGLTLVGAWYKAGFAVTGVDVNEEYVKRLNALDLGFIQEDELRSVIVAGVKDGNVTFTTDGVSASRKSHVHLVAVPTLLNRDSHSFEPTALKEALRTISQGLKRGDLVILESSVPPGTTSGLVREKLESESGLRAERDFCLAYSPERVYIGRAYDDLVRKYPKVIGGIGPLSTKTASDLYSRVVEKGTVVVRDAVTAELVKLFEGIYRDVNIALANELAVFCEKLGVNYYEVRDAANTQPYSHLHTPGAGVGGVCIPFYPYFVIEVAKKRGVALPLVSLARSINESLPHRTVGLFLDTLYQVGIRKENASVAVLGIAFRGDTSDTRNSPGVEVIKLLASSGLRDLIAHDPYATSDPELEPLGVRTTSDLAGALRGRNGIVITADHSAYRSLTLKTVKDLTGSERVVVLDAKRVLQSGHAEGVTYVLLGSGTF